MLKQKDAVKLMHEGNLALNEATLNGMRVDVDYCKDMDVKLAKRLKGLESKIHKSTLGKHWSRKYRSKVNVRSDLQLRTVLFNQMGLPVIKETDKGNPSVDAETLDVLSNEEPSIKLINDYKRIYVAHNTFIKGYLKEQTDGWLHPGFPLNLATTFRGTSEGPNFQQTPKRDALQRKIVRQAIIPRKGNFLMEADYSGIEVRIACCVTGDKKLSYDTVHGDMHRDMAVEIYILDSFKKEGSEKKLRNGAKNGFVFPQFYGDYYGNNAPILLKWADLPVQGTFTSKTGLQLLNGAYISDHLISKGIKTVKAFTDHIEGIEYSFWNERYKTYGNWRKRKVKEYNKKGYLQTVTGFICKGVITKNKIVNYEIQGPAFHCLLYSLTEIGKRMKKYKMKSKIIGQIHDAIVFDAKPKEKEVLIEIIKQVMVDWIRVKWKWISVPLEVEADLYGIDSNWASKSKTLVFKD